MKELFFNPWYSSIIVLIIQIIFLYLRTLNTIYTVNNNIPGAIFSGLGIGLSWLIGIAIGSNAILNLEWQPVLAHLLGGSIGTYWAMKNSKNKNKNV